MAPSAAAGRSRPGEAVAVAPCHDTPALTMNGRVIEQRCVDLRSALPGVALHFAVEANPAAAGAYTASYSSVGFNGFSPLREEYR